MAHRIEVLGVARREWASCGWLAAAVAVLGIGSLACSLLQSEEKKPDEAPAAAESGAPAEAKKDGDDAEDADEAEPAASAATDTDEGAETEGTEAGGTNTGSTGGTAPPKPTGSTATTSPSGSGSGAPTPTTTTTPTNPDLKAQCEATCAQILAGMSSCPKDGPAAEPCVKSIESSAASCKARCANL